jgi:hypothetical protein
VKRQPKNGAAHRLKTPFFQADVFNDIVMLSKEKAFFSKTGKFFVRRGKRRLADLLSRRMQASGGSIRAVFAPLFEKG